MVQGKLNGFEVALASAPLTGPTLGRVATGAMAAAALLAGLAVGGVAGGKPSAGPEDGPREVPAIAGASSTARTEFGVPGLGSAALAVSHPVLLAGGKRTLYAEVELTGAEAPVSERAEGRAAVALVLDRSGSMAGSKIVDAKEALLRFVDGLADEDRVSIVIYDDVAEVLLPLSPASVARERARALLSNVQDRGSTNIAGGLNLATDSLRSSPENAVRRVLLFSDGLDTSGTPKEAILSGVRSAASRGVSFSALGIGTDYDAEFMAEVANLGHGTYAYLGNREMLHDFVARELRAFRGAVADAVAVTFELPRGWRVEHAFGADVSGAKGAVRVPVGTLSAGEQRRVVLMLGVEAPRFGVAGELRARVSYRAAGAPRAAETRSEALAVSTSHSREAVDEARDMVVWGHGEALLMSERQAHALAAWRAGRVEEAKRELGEQRARAKAVMDAQIARGVAPAQVAETKDLMEDLEVGYGTVSSVRADSKLGKARDLSFGAKRAARHKSGAAAMEAPAAAEITADTLGSLY